MKLICPVCNNEDKFEEVAEEKKIIVRGEPISVNMKSHKCEKCGEQFLIEGLDNDPLATAFNIYRIKHNLLKPEEIRNFREKYQLTQVDLAKLLGMGVATINRYESGKLQEESNETLLRLAMQPECFKNIVTNSKEALTDTKKKNILKTFEQNNEQRVESLKQFITFNLQSQEINECSGFKQFDFEKLTNAVLFFCKEGVTKTKLNKLLFYADFIHFKEYVFSITGSQYVHVPFGPAPYNYDLIYPIFLRQELISMEEVNYGEYSGEQYTAIKEPDLNKFTESELKVLATVKVLFKVFTASQLSVQSHQEKGYHQTINGETISYVYASDLHW